MKGQDPLNNLFRVLLRFIENEFAIIADVTKMYHKILIIEQDQLDQRCIWRDMEVDRKPDVYVNPIMTFGDKPTAAMALTALRKQPKKLENIARKHRKLSQIIHIWMTFVSQWVLSTKPEK